MTVSICKAPAALELGFRCCFLRLVQQWAWERWDEVRLPITPYLRLISGRLLVVSEGIDRQRWSLFEGLMAEAKRNHRLSLQHRDRLLAELAEQVGDAAEARRLLPGRVQALGTDLRERQKQDWEAITVFTLRCVEADPHLTAWWELGFEIGSRAFCLDTEKDLLAYQDHASSELWWAADRLPESERAWLKELLPAKVEADVYWSCRLVRAFKDIRAGLTQIDRERGLSSVERRFRHNPDFSKCWWLPIGWFENDGTERVVIQRLFEDMEQGGRGVTLKELLVGTERDDLTRMDNVFLHGKHPHRWYNPAWQHGLIQSVRVGKYRMNLQGHRGTQK
jgi:hypothetical protein